MCGRYSEVAKLNALAKRFKFPLPGFDLSPRYNVAPSQEAPVVINETGRELKMMRWGLIPPWAKDMKIGYKMINARAESVAEKPSYKRPFLSRRCLVLADGYYEWEQPPGQKNKRPMRVVLKNRQPFAMAGLYENWEDPKHKKVIPSFAIVTTSAAQAIQHIHDRMPVLLKEQDEEIWLDPDLKDPEKLLSLTMPYEDDIEAYEVSRLVNSPANDIAECLEAVRST